MTTPALSPPAFPLTHHISYQGIRLQVGTDPSDDSESASFPVSIRIFECLVSVVLDRSIPRYDGIRLLIVCKEEMEELPSVRRSYLADRLLVQPM
jgi:hypothetical protein